MKLLLTGLAAVVSALSLVASAGADPPQQSIGTGVVTAPALSNVHAADGNVLADFTQTGILAGTFTGTMDVAGHLIVHADGSIDILNASITFTGTTPCGLGTVQFVGRDQTSGGVGTGKVQSIDDATNTVDVHSVDDLTVALPAFSYQGTYHCGP